MLQELRPRDASLIRQRYFDSKTYREIAAALGMADNQIGVTLARAESRLRAKLRQSYPDLFD
jgi:RNA polymerase sigma factor (sigma-70 family)